VTRRASPGRIRPVIDSPADLAPLAVSTLHIVAASAVTIDAVLRKRHVSAAFGWVGLAWLAPVVGPLLYACFGINRIRRNASELRLQAAWDAAGTLIGHGAPVASIQRASFAGLAQVGEAVTGGPLLAGNAIEPLVDGDAAFPAMLAAIDAAQHNVTMLSYIFDNDTVGLRFLAALRDAVARGVQVRVLIDDVGTRYTRPTMARLLREAGIPVATFLPTRLSLRFRYANLRNHRKILVIDGRHGYTGGMNVRAGHWIGQQPANPIRCMHFRVAGPVVADLQRTFAVDWAFTTGEHLRGDDWFPPLQPAGSVAARGVPDGPDADLDHILNLLLAAIAVATERIRIVTPYFLPDDAILRSLQVAAMRGVAVDIVVPGRSNVFLMDWAMAPQFAWLLKSGCRLHLSSGVFDHTKLLTVDGCWSMIGSTNWDARSLRLNFEYNLECYDAALANRLDGLIDAKIATSRRIEPEDLEGLSLPVRLRNGLARMMQPYL
jgi:cardiolipin synthase A/B